MFVPHLLTSTKHVEADGNVNSLTGICSEKKQIEILTQWGC